MSLPDCRSIEIHHWWASPPPKGTSILHQAMQSEYFPPFPTQTESLGLLDGLAKLEKISLESPPELDSTLLVQLLGHRDPLASHLRHLELRFCNLDLAVIAKLIQQASQSLTHLTLLLGGRTDTSSYYREEPPHLCPLIREFSKNLVCLEYAAPTLCPAIFYDSDELQEIRKNRGTTDGSDTYAIRESVLNCRRRKNTRYHKKRIEKALQESGGKSRSHIETSTELLLGREEEDRKRTIQNSRSKWKRKLISWHRTCTLQPWTEIQQGADLAEAGVEWTLASKTYRTPLLFGQWDG